MNDQELRPHVWSLAEPKNTMPLPVTEQHHESGSVRVLARVAWIGTCFRTVRCLAVAVPTLALSTFVASLPVRATDFDLVFPTGWHLDPPSAPYAISANVFVTALEGSQGAGTSRVVQYRNFGESLQTMVTTDLPGRVASVQISPDGNRVLTHQKIAGLPAGTWRITMLDSSGTVLWARDENKVYRFSTTGESVSANGPIGEMGTGPELEVYSLDGTLRRSIHLAEPGATPSSGYLVLNDAILVGVGDRVILASRKFFWSASTINPASVYWGFPRPDNIHPEVMKVRTLDSSNIATEETGRGQFRVIDISTGAVRYRFDPDLLPENEAFSGTNWNYWTAYRAFTDATPGTIVLSNKTSTAYRLELSTGELTPFSVNVSPPTGYLLRAGFSTARTIFLSPSGARIRSTPQLSE